ncbi:hypothetical protein TNCV_2192961, partial [Trichonephila clavipes]
QPIFFGPHGGVGVSDFFRPLAYVHRGPPSDARYVLFGWTPVPVTKVSCPELRVFSVLFRWAVNCIYRSLVDVVVRDLPPVDVQHSCLAESIPRPCNNTPLATQWHPRHYVVFCPIPVCL